MRSLKLLIIFALGMTLVLARADEAADKYLVLFNLIEQADALSAKGERAAANSKYREAHSALIDFKRAHPSYNTRMISYRINYVVEKIVATNPEIAAPTNREPVQSHGGSVAGSVDNSVKLLEAGAEPRQVLRLQPKEGEKQRLKLTIRTGMEMKAGDTTMPAMDVPALVALLEVTVKEISPEGDIIYETLVSDVTIGEGEDVAPEIATVMKSALAGIKGVSGSGRINCRGINKGIQLKSTEGSLPQLRQTMEQMKDFLSNISAPFPEEEVGVGGKWQARMRLKNQGVSLDQVVDCEIVSLEEQKLTLKTKITQTAARQKVDNPAMPGLKMDLVKLNGTGNGEVTSDLTRLLPLAGKTDMLTEMAMGMNMGGQSQVISVKVNQRLKFEAN